MQSTGFLAQSNLRSSPESKTRYTEGSHRWGLPDTHPVSIVLVEFSWATTAEFVTESLHVLGETGVELWTRAMIVFVLFFHQFSFRACG